MGGLDIQLAKVSYDTVILGGGLDQATPTLELDAAHVRNSLNYEAAVTGGYSRIAGYERFDGQKSPSTANVAVLFVASFVNVPAVGNTLLGGTSGATGAVIAVGANYIAITQQVGAFALGESLNVGTTVMGTYVVPANAIPIGTLAVYNYLATQVYRNYIQQVPGSGAVLGCVMLYDVLYAWRANVAGTAVNIYKSTITGWVQVPLYNEISFTSGGTATPVDGATLTQGGKTATVKRVVSAGGAWSGSAFGRFIITNPTGGNFSAGAATLTGGATVTLSSAQTAITISVGGKYEFDVGTLFAGSNINRAYGCDGTNRGFEFDGSVYVPLSTGTVPDSPSFVQLHKGYLFWAIQSSLVFSAPGLPYDYTALSGAGEIGIDDSITGLTVMPGSQQTAALLVTTRSGTNVLYGIGASSTNPFNLISYNTGAGAIPHTALNMDQTYMMDDRGVASLQSTLNFGNFDSATLTANIKPYIESKRGKVLCAALNRSKSQYRLFFSDATALYITVVNQKLMGCMPMFFPVAAYQIHTTKFQSGEEATFMCGTDGYVYQMEKGTSFDGANIEAYFTLNNNSSKSPRLRKRYRKAAVEVSGAGYSEFSFGYSLGYASPNVTQALPVTYQSNSNALNWDSFTWDNFIWDGNSVQPNETEMVGTAENVAITVRSTSPYWPQFTVNSIIIHYSGRRMMR